MTHLTALEIESIARLNNLRMTAVCKLAGVHYGTFWRWKSRGRPITIDAYERLVAAAKGELTGDGVK